MIATARRQAEGSLIYIIDKADLYLRVRDGVRQVMVQPSSFHSEHFTFVACCGKLNHIATIVTQTNTCTVCLDQIIYHLYSLLLAWRLQSLL